MSLAINKKKEVLDTNSRWFKQKSDRLSAARRAEEACELAAAYNAKLIKDQKDLKVAIACLINLRALYGPYIPESEERDATHKADCKAMNDALEADELAAGNNMLLFVHLPYAVL